MEVLRLSTIYRPAEEVSTLTETIGQEMIAVIAKTLSPKGRVVSPTELWNAVGKGEEVHSHRFQRYRSVLSELLRNRKIEIRKDGDVLKGFEWIGKPFKHQQGRHCHARARHDG